MTIRSPRPPAIPHGRYWHVKAYLRALRMLAFGMVVSFSLYVWGAGRAIGHYIGANPIHNPDAVARTRERFPLLTDAYQTPVYETFYELFVRSLSYEPILVVLAGGLLCTAALEIIERRRRRER